MSAVTPADGSSFAPVYIESIEVRDFRGLVLCALELERELTLLVGRNNSGKSRILRAIAIALGGEAVDVDDLTVSGPDVASVDVVIAPAHEEPDTRDEVFDDAVAQRLGTGPINILSEEPSRERAAYRTTISRSAEGLGARSVSQWLTFDAATQTWVLPANAAEVGRNARRMIAVDLVDARRDIVEDLGRRGSAVRRVLSDLEVDAAKREELETTLSELGVSIMSSSGTLADLKSSLDALSSVIGEIGSPILNPLPGRLEELARTVAIDLDTGSGALPIRLHGSGARSLASLQVQGVLYGKRLGRDGPSIRPHPVTLVEEPETHLHPQATMELQDLFSTMPGQVIASTHSAHLVTTVEPRAIRLIRAEGSITRIVDLGPSSEDGPHLPRGRRTNTHATEMEKLKRLVERPFGEMVFASALVIGDGATERAFLPIAIRHALGSKAHGVCVIDPGSMNTDLPTAALKFAELAGIPAVLFCDSDDKGQRAGKGLIAQFGNDPSLAIWVQHEDGATSEFHAIEGMLIAADDPMCRAVVLELRPDFDETKTTIQLLTDLKGSGGAALGRSFVELFPKHEDWPLPLRQLIQTLSSALTP